MQWTTLDRLTQLEEIRNSDNYHIIFKHSTRCPVSSMAKKQFEFEAHLLPDGITAYLLDLIKHRDISNAIAEDWNVMHESPQVLLLKGKDCIFNESHHGIQIEYLLKHL